MRNTRNAYGAGTAFHWLVVIGITPSSSGRGVSIRPIRFAPEFSLVNQHKSIGMTVLALVVLRLLWRAFNRPPAFPSAMTVWERRAAATAHWLLYALILAMPLTGWMYSSAAGFGAEFFGLLDIPDFVAQSERLEGIFGTIHEWLAKAILLVVTIHMLAALRHQFVLKDGLLGRMLPVWK